MTKAKWQKRLGISAGAVAIALVGAFIGGKVLGVNQLSSEKASADHKNEATILKDSNGFRPTDSQWATITVEPAKEQPFQPFDLTEGKISVNEDLSTSIFSPYSGRILKLLVKPGDEVKRGQPLFVIEATDAVQVHNDFITSIAALNKSKAQVSLAQTVEKRLHDLFEMKAAALKDWQQAQTDLVNAQNDLNAAEAALEAARNRLRILGRSDDEIASFQQKRTITPETAIVAPISGTVVQRKAGPGQFITGGSSDPIFIIGDLSSVWLTAFVRESEAPKVHVGQDIKIKVLAYPDRTFSGKLSYVATAIDPVTRRLLVRATLDNAEGLLRPEMFANVTILTGNSDSFVGVPRGAVIYEGSAARIWVARDDRSLELRPVELGLVSGNTIQVLKGLKAGEKVVTRGSLFIDREASAN